jgi:hypothetical protein
VAIHIDMPFYSGLTHEFINKLMKNYRYFWCSIIFHVFIICTLSHIALKPVVDNTIDQRVKISMSNTYRMNMQQGVKHIAQIQNDLVNTLDAAAKENLKLEPITAKDIENQKVTSSQLVELARKISENIRKIERELRVQDLQKAVFMPRDDVLKRVLLMEVGLPAYRGNSKHGSAMVKMVKDMEERAQNSLRNRESDIKKRGVGNSTLAIEKPDDLNTARSGNNDHNLIKGIASSINKGGEPENVHIKNNFVDLWLDHIPSVNRQNPKKVAGRILKNGGQYADRVFVNSWYIIGPFALSGKHPPEYAVDLDAIYYGKDNTTVGWQYVSNSQYPLTPPQVDKAGVFYGYTEIMVDREQDLWVWIGADDFASLELNDKLIWNSDVFNKNFNSLAYEKNNPERGNWNLTEFKRLVHFKAGRNTFKFKLTNSDTTTFFSLVLTK